MGVAAVSFRGWGRAGVVASCFFFLPQQQEIRELKDLTGDSLGGLDAATAVVCRCMPSGHVDPWHGLVRMLAP